MNQNPSISCIFWLDVEHSLNFYCGRKKILSRFSAEGLNPDQKMETESIFI